MSVNWDILNKEFDSIINNISDADWDRWAANREAKKAMRREVLNMKARIHAFKMQLFSTKCPSYNIEVNPTIYNYAHVNFDEVTKKRIAKAILDNSYSPPLAA